MHMRYCIQSITDERETTKARTLRGKVKDKIVPACHRIKLGRLEIPLITLPGFESEIELCNTHLLKR